MSDNYNDIDRELGWDDEITSDAEYELLPAGDYDFEVTKFERSRSKGSDSCPSSNMAVLTLRVTDGTHTGVVTDQLVLRKKMEWKLCQFFCAIGQMKREETLRMNWNAVTGAKGRCKIKIDSWTGRDGSEKQNNKVEKYYDADTVPVQAAQTEKKSWF